MNDSKSTAKKINELYELIDEIEVALMTTRRPDGLLVTRPMATQKRNPIADLWFVTDIETYKIDELKHDENVCLGYYNSGTKEWVSVSGTATISQDRKAIRELHQADWKTWFPDEGGDRNGGPDDPRLALILVEAHLATYMKTDQPRPYVLFEIARGLARGESPDIGRQEHVSKEEMD